KDCCICCDSLKNVSSFPADDDESCEDNPNRVIKLHKCSHVFHYNCLLAMYNSGKKEGSIQCPSCKYIYGIKYGDCPSGSMSYEILNNCSLSGYPDCGVIKITYDIKNGIQESFHPNPGKQYTATGFPRYGYLPHNLDGLKILQLLKKAWFRRLTFTIGTSVTTGRANVVVWNEIHHKTEMDNKSGHGYPDPEYLNNVTKELTFHGVVEKDDNELEYND
ncbi:hypothetical protein HELRODRAFT_67514, partial [Helobdella robusta]|uniref:E3 ubiquitin-protein ligase n=1 Tax=Helobdella robusta TaxID=6412 RepID=T1FZ20_HELRO